MTPTAAAPTVEQLADSYSPHLRLCHELGKQLHEVMGWPGPLTHRQHRVWQEWLGRQWNEPSRTDHYLMQLSMLLLAVNTAKGKRPKLDDMRIKFGRGDKKGTPFKSAEEAAAVAKGRWFGLLGLDGQGRSREDVVRQDEDGDDDTGKGDTRQPQASPRKKRSHASPPSGKSGGLEVEPHGDGM